MSLDAEPSCSAQPYLQPRHPEQIVRRVQSDRIRDITALLDSVRAQSFAAMAPPQRVRAEADF